MRHVALLNETLIHTHTSYAQGKPSRKGEKYNFSIFLKAFPKQIISELPRK